MIKFEHICVLGLGYIGLPTASLFATNGFRVTGVDTNPRVVELVNQGQVHIEEPGLNTLVHAATQSGRLVATCEAGVPDCSVDREVMVVSEVRDAQDEVVAVATVTWRVGPQGAAA